MHEVEEGRRTPIERQLVAIWRGILDIPMVGPREDIYEAGATSMRAAVRMDRRGRCGGD